MNWSTLKVLNLNFDTQCVWKIVWNILLSFLDFCRDVVKLRQGISLAIMVEDPFLER